MQKTNLNQKSTNTHQKEQAYLRAQKQVKSIKGFYWHAFWYLIINIFLISILAINTSNIHFWQFSTFSTASFWGLGLAFHALAVFGKNLIFSKTWEEKKINQYIEKDKKQWK